MSSLLRWEVVHIWKESRSPSLMEAKSTPSVGPEKLQERVSWIWLVGTNSLRRAENENGGPDDAISNKICPNPGCCGDWINLEAIDRWAGTVRGGKAAQWGGAHSETETSIESAAGRRFASLSGEEQQDGGHGPGFIASSRNSSQAGFLINRYCKQGSFSA